MPEPYVVYPNVHLGKNVTIEEFCVIGKPPVGVAVGELETFIGDNAVLRSGTVIYAGNRIGSGFQTGHHVVVRESNTIGDDVSIGSLSCVEHHVILEDGVRLHSQCFVPEYSVLKKRAWLGPHCVLTNAKYPRSRNVKQFLVGAVLEENVKVGANSTILPGVQIGRDSLIGAGSTVTKDIPAGVVAVGNPAVVVREVSQIEAYQA